jgi:ABC-type polysaccharide/polyol phosphate export permease/GT2 family glycosyltransferase
MSDAGAIGQAQEAPQSAAEVTSAASQPFVSICIVSGRRRELLARCLDSLRSQEAPPDFELIVGADEDRSVEQVVYSRFADADVVHISHSTPAGLRNSLLRRASGEWLLFLDDDVEIEPSFLRTMHELAIADPGLGVLGGPNVAPRERSRFQSVQDAVLSSIVGTGPVRRRYGRHPARDGDERQFTLCTLAVRREVMADFDERLVCAEENELLEGLRGEGVRMRYEPALLSHHERRPTWRSFAAQMHRYGHGRGQLLARRPRATRLAHVVPVLLLLYCVCALPAAVLLDPLVLAPLLLYVAAVSATGVRVGLSLGNLSLAPLATALTFTVHLWYGSGVLRGLVGSAFIRAWKLLAAPIRHRDLLGTLIVRQLKLRSKRTFIGMVWPLSGPLFLFGLYLFVFQAIFNVPIDNYPVYLFAGLLPWTFLTQTLGASVIALSSEPELIRRSRFPYELIPVATVSAMSLYFLLALGGFVVYLAITGELAFAVLPVLIVPVACLYLFVGALAVLLALIDVYNRDLRHVLANLLTVWFFLVPIVYTQQDLGQGLQFLDSVDPANLIVGQFRDVLYHGTISHPGHMVEMLAICLATWLVCLEIFRRHDPRLPKEV